MSPSRAMRALCMAIALLAASAALVRAQSPPATAVPARATVDELAWVAGAWTGMVGDRAVEQHWSAPVAGSIVAMYRSIRGGRPLLYELLAMENDGEGVVLRIKHFAPGAGLVGQEAKDQSLDHALVEIGGRRAVFQGGTPESPVRITFTQPESNALTILVERVRAGKPAATEFKYRRMGS